MVWNTIKNKPLRKNSQYFKCMICSEINERSKIAKKGLIQKKTYINHEICCICLDNVINDNIIRYLKNSLIRESSINIHSTKTIHSIKLKKSVLNKYIYIKEYFKLFRDKKEVK